MHVIKQRPLWSLHRGTREATAEILIYSFGRELRVDISGETVFKRLLRDSEDESAASAQVLKAFTSQGWERAREVP